jgi:hypothetical protein
MLHMRVMQERRTSTIDSPPKVGGFDRTTGASSAAACCAVRAASCSAVLAATVPSCCEGVGEPGPAATPPERIVRRWGSNAGSSVRAPGRPDAKSSSHERITAATEPGVALVRARETTR